MSWNHIINCCADPIKLWNSIKPSLFAKTSKNWLSQCTSNYIKLQKIFHNIILKHMEYNTFWIVRLKLLKWILHSSNKSAFNRACNLQYFPPVTHFLSRFVLQFTKITELTEINMSLVLTNNGVHRCDHLKDG